ncbi:MAG: hypothetical protein WC375_05420 [Methanomassiliicoccales archaeon]|jgi:hypothetical protein
MSTSSETIATKFRMMRRPTKPVEKIAYPTFLFSQRTDTNAPLTLPFLLKRIKEMKWEIDECIVIGSYNSVEIRVLRKAPSNNFAKRMLKYEQKLKDYNKWMQDHSDEIQTIKHAKEIKELESKRKSKARLQKKRDVLEKKIREMESQGI